MKKIAGLMLPFFQDDQISAISFMTVQRRMQEK